MAVLVNAGVPVLVAVMVLVGVLEVVGVVVMLIVPVTVLVALGVGVAVIVSVAVAVFVTVADSVEVAVSIMIMVAGRDGITIVGMVVGLGKGLRAEPGFVKMDQNTVPNVIVATRVRIVSKSQTENFFISMQSFLQIPLSQNFRKHFAPGFALGCHFKSPTDAQ